VRTDGDVRADFHGPAFVVEESETVTTAGCLEGARIADQADSVGGQPPGQGVDVGGGRGPERDQVDPLVGGLP
jgi:hypothetical protein